MPNWEDKANIAISNFFTAIKNGLTAQTIIIITVCLVAVIITAALIKKHKRKG